MERHPEVRAVDRLSPHTCLPVEVAPDPHEGRHVGDGVPDAVTLAVPLEVHGLVEIHRSDRVDREEREAGLVTCRQPWWLRRHDGCFRQRLRGIVERQAELGAHRRETVTQRGEHPVGDGRVRGVQSHARVRHEAQPSSLPAARTSWQLGGHGRERTR